MFAKEYLKYRLRSGRRFKRLLKEHTDRDRFTPQEMEAYRTQRLMGTIHIAYECVPFYCRIFRDRGLAPDDIQSTSDLKKLPIIDKEVVREHFREFRNRKYKGLVAKGLTSGSTGKPGVYLRDLASINYEKAALWRQYQWGGKQLDSKRVTLRGELICSVDNTQPPFWKYRPFANELVMSSYHLADQYLKHYAREILAFQPYDLYAYPSTAHLLASYCTRHHISLRFGAVFTSAEVLFDYQREAIEQAFQCRVFDQYGSAERVVNISQCEKGTYHEISDYSITEYVKKEGNQYELIGTTLFNTVMPLIRFRLGDIVELTPHTKCPCGRDLKVIDRIIGRSDDAITLKDGRKLTRLDHILKAVDFVKEAQIIQTSLDDIVVKVVPSRKITDRDRNVLLHKLHQYVGKDISYDIQVVSYIPRGKNAKYKLVVNRLP